MQEAQEFRSIGQTETGGARQPNGTLGGGGGGGVVARGPSGHAPSAAEPPACPAPCPELRLVLKVRVTGVT